MKTKLPRFPVLRTVAIMTAFAYSAAKIDSAEPEIGRPVAPSANASNYPAARAASDNLLPRAQRMLSRHESVAAKIRQQVDLFGKRLVGSGHYLQHGTGTDLKMRMELKIQNAGQVDSILQVADGRFLWIERQLGKEAQLTRIDPAQVRAAWSRALRVSSDDNANLAASDRPRNRTILPPEGAMVVGGLGELLGGLDRNFEFLQVEETELSGVPVHAALGRWRRERLVENLPGQRDELREGKYPRLDGLPPQTPHEVLLVLGRDDLFPYVVEYRRATKGRMAPILRMEMFEVAIGGPIDPRNFVYKPSDGVTATDGTQDFLQRWK